MFRSWDADTIFGICLKSKISHHSLYYAALAESNASPPSKPPCLLQGERGLLAGTGDAKFARILTIF